MKITFSIKGHEVIVDAESTEVINLLPKVQELLESVFRVPENRPS